MKKIIIWLVANLCLLNACGAPGDIEVHQAWVRPTAQGENAAVYMLIHNHSDIDDKLTGASSDAADVIEIHESSMQDDVMQMNRVDSVAIGHGKEVLFKPGGLHIMLINIKREFILGDHVGVVLHFENHEDIVVEVHIEDTVPDEDHDH